MTAGNLIDTIKLPFRKDKALYRAFYSIMGFYPRNISFYREAIMHSSLSARQEGRPLNNERLEFLGDAILDAAVGDIVFRHFQLKREGFLTNARSKIVQRETLGHVARQLGIDKLVRSTSHGNAHNSYVGGNAFEALMGAIYLDRGYGYCMRFLEQRILNGKVLDIEKISNKETNFKSRILEFCQKRHLSIELPLIDEQRDEAGAPFFRSKVMIEGVECGLGRGYSKKESQQQACKNAYHNLRHKKAIQKLLQERKKED